MIKWLWKANQPQAEMLAQWREALNIPLLAPLNEQEQQRLASVASYLLQQKRLVHALVAFVVRCSISTLLVYRCNKK